MSTVPHVSSSINAKPFAETSVFDEWFAALHHAAHAVAAHVLAVDFSDVKLLPTDDYHEAGASDELLFTSTRWFDVRRGAMTRLAGDIAEYVADSRAQWGAVIISCEIAEWRHGEEPQSVDRFKAFLGVEKRVGTAFRTVMPDVVADTFSLTLANWDVIERVAIELIARGVIDADRLRQIVGDSSVVPADVIVGGGVCLN